MPTISVVISEADDNYITESISRAFNGKFGAKKRVQLAALKLYADALNGLNVEEQYKKSLAEIKSWLEQANQKKALEAAKEILIDQTRKIINPEQNPPHEIYGEPYPAKVVEQKSPEIPRSNEQEVREVSFVTDELEANRTGHTPVITNTETIKVTGIELVQVGNKSFPEYDKLSYEELMEAKTKFAEFKTEDDTDRYNYIIRRMIEIKRTP